MPAFTLGETFQKPTTMMYRNLLAMETEELLRSYPADGCVLMGGCDKTTPALLMGAISMNLPAIYVPAGPMLRGNWHGEILAVDRMCRSIGRNGARKCRSESLDADRRRHRSLGRNLHDDGHGLHHDQHRRGPRLLAPRCERDTAVDSNHAKMANRSGRRIVELVWEDLKPRDILHDASFNNAIATVFALGGSTNAVIHLLALAGRAGIKLALDRFDQFSRKTPMLANLRRAAST